MAKQEHTLELTVSELPEPQRVDAWVAHISEAFPRSASSDQNTEFYINGVPVKKSKKVQPGDQVMVKWTEHLLDAVSAQDIPLHILYEDDQVVVIDKQQGLVVHPGAGNPDETLVNALVHRYGDQFFSSDESPSIRPGIVHRLDKDTSGVMVIAKDRITHEHLAAQFHDRQIKKHYIALVEGILPRHREHIETGIIRDARDRRRFAATDKTAGKWARTDYVVLRQLPHCALIRIRLHTGRTHQIRVHMAHIGHPVIGDPLYGLRKSYFTDQSLMLHAFSLEFSHPVSHQMMRFRAPLPDRFKSLILGDQVTILG